MTFWKCDDPRPRVDGCAPKPKPRKPRLRTIAEACPPPTEYPKSITTEHECRTYRVVKANGKAIEIEASRCVVGEAGQLELSQMATTCGRKWVDQNFAARRDAAARRTMSMIDSMELRVGSGETYSRATFTDAEFDAFPVVWEAEDFGGFVYEAQTLFCRVFAPGEWREYSIVGGDSE